MVKSADVEIKDTAESEGSNNNALGMYELSYHLSSYLSEEEMAAAAQKIQDLLKKHGGVVSVEESPKLRTLAYTIEYTFEGKKEKIDTAYFGFSRFTASGEEMPALLKSLQLMPRLARFLLIDLPPAALALPRRFGMDGNGQPKGDKTPETKESPVAGISSEELDKTIDELVV